jgi:hypothetical protein
MKLKTSVTRILLLYGFLGAGIVIFGGFTNEIFFVLFGLSITIIGLVMANALQIKHISDMLKKYNMWSGDLEKIKKDTTLESISEHNKKQNEKNSEIKEEEKK